MSDEYLPEIHLSGEEYDRYYNPRYTSNDITKRFDITMGKFRDLYDRGFIKPSEESPGQGKRALFNRIDIYAFLLFLALVKRGFSRKLASRLSQQLRGVNSPLKISDRVAFTTAIREGEEDIGTLYFNPSDLGLDTIKGTQAKFAKFLSDLLSQPGFKDMIIVNLVDIRKEVDNALG